MSEHDETTPASQPPPPPNVASEWSPPPGLRSEIVIESRPPSRRPAAYIAVVIGLLAMVGGAVFFARSLGSSQGGADTPAAAVQRMFDSLSDEDALGVLESLLPSERDQFRGPLQDITKELGRLGILSRDVDLGSISGFEFDFSDLRYTTEERAAGVSAVTLESGRFTYRIEPARAPLGDFVRDLLPPEANEVVEGSSDDPGDTVIITIKDGDKWYVSLWYSVAESAREAAGAPLPPFGNGLRARGAASPEKAVEELILSAAGLDVRRLIELLPPEEARALHDYALLFIDEVEAEVRELRRGFEFDIRTLDLSTSGSGDRVLVKVDEIAFAANIPALGGSVEFDGECLTMPGEFFGGSEPLRQCGRGPVPAFGIPQVPTPDLGIVTVQVNGQWYVSPTGTILDGLLGTLKALQPGHLQTFKEFFVQFSGG